MDDLHLTKELLTAVVDRRLDPGSLADMATAHLLEICQVCRAEFDAWSTAARRDTPANHALAFAQAFTSLGRKGARISADRDQARSLARSLLALPAHERASAVERTPHHFRGAALAELLIGESLSRMPARPGEALALARLAKAVLQHSELSGYVVELFARAVAHVANAQRALGHLPQSADLLDSARFLLRTHGGCDRLTRAELDHFEGSLRRAQRRFAEAEKLLTRAARWYKMAGARVEAASVSLSLSLLYYETGQAEQGLKATEDAMHLLDPVKELRLFFCACHNRGLCLCEAGRYHEAREAVRMSRAFYQQAEDELSQLRCLWLEGKIARGLGELTLAESFLASARGGFAAHRFAYLSALVGLELADLYLMQGRKAEARSLAAEIAPVFEAQEVQRELAAVLILVREGASSD